MQFIIDVIFVCIGSQLVNKKIAKKNNIMVIEDAAQAIGTQYKDGNYSGTIGHVGCYSFFPSKNLGCFGDGGLVVTNDENLALMLKIKRVHGGEPKYYHKVIGCRPGQRTCPSCKFQDNETAGSEFPIRRLTSPRPLCAPDLRNSISGFLL